MSRSTTNGTVLWYVHDHGSGHLHRAMAVIPFVAAPVVIACGPHVFEEARELFGDDVVLLPGDVPASIEPTTGPFHFAPPGRVTRDRTNSIVAAVVTRDCTTAVVDVSVEVTVLARLLGLRVVSVRQSGCRSDDAHRLAFASADVVWVPQRRELEPIDDAVEPVDDRWVFTGAFSRFDGRDVDPTGSQRREQLIVLLVGFGGHSLAIDGWRGAVPPEGWSIVIVGGTSVWTSGAVRSVGRVDDVFALLQTAAIVVTSGGWASTADVIAAGARLVTVAEPRPFDEQLVRARALEAAQLVARLDQWPEPAELPEVIDLAMRLPLGASAVYSDGLGATRAAAMIDQLHSRPVDRPL